MSISFQNLYEDIVQQLGTGSGSSRLSNAFIRASNRTLDEISVRAALDSRLPHISGVDETISRLDSQYEGIIYSGIYYWLVRMGHAASDPRIASVQYKDSKEMWAESIGNFIMAESNLLQSDTDNSIVGIGVLDT